MIQFAKAYPSLSSFVEKYGEIYLGDDAYNGALVTVATENDIIWQSSSQQRNIDNALEAAERVVQQWLSRHAISK